MENTPTVKYAACWWRATWVITGVCFVLGLHKGGENLTGAGLMAIGLGVLGLYVTRPRKD